MAVVSNCSDCSHDTLGHYQPYLGISPKSQDCGYILVETIINSKYVISTSRVGHLVREWTISYQYWTLLLCQMVGRTKWTEISTGLGVSTTYALLLWLADQWPTSFAILVGVDWMLFNGQRQPPVQVKTTCQYSRVLRSRRIMLVNNCVYPSLQLTWDDS